MSKFVITVAISVEADDEASAEMGLQGALDNLIGGDLGSYEVIEVREHEAESD